MFGQWLHYYIENLLGDTSNDFDVNETTLKLRFIVDHCTFNKIYKFSFLKLYILKH